MTTIIRYPDNYGNDYNPKGLWLPFLQHVAEDLENLKYPIKNDTNTLDSYIKLLYGPGNAIHENLLKAHLLPKAQDTQHLYNINNALEWMPTIFTYQHPLKPDNPGFPPDWEADYQKVRDPLATFLHQQNYFGNSYQKALTIELYITPPQLHPQTQNRVNIADALANHLTLLTNGIYQPLDNTPGNLYNSFWRCDFPKWAFFKKTYTQYLKALAKAEKKTAKKNRT